MQTAKRQSWKINLSAKSNAFHLKFKARITKPTACNFLKLSLFLKIRESILHLNNTAESPISILRKPKTFLKSKFLKFFRKFKAPLEKNRAITAQQTLVLQKPDCKLLSYPFTRLIDGGPISIESLLVGTLALLSKSIYENDQNGIKFHATSILLLTALSFMKYAIIRLRKLMVYLTIALVLLAIMYPLDKYIYRGSRDYYAFQLLCKAWSCVASSGSLCVLFLVVFSRFCAYVGASCRRNS